VKLAELFNNVLHQRL